MSCNDKKVKTHDFTTVNITTFYEDSVSIRAIEVWNNTLAFAGNNGVFGAYDIAKEKLLVQTQQYDSILPEFRAVAHTENDFFMLSVANPALLYKTGDAGKMELVYTEEGEKVFYDAMTFFDDDNGIAVGDPTTDCASIIITRDGGNSWNKIACDKLPKLLEGEAFFAASNTNIAVFGSHAWIASGGERSAILHTSDMGETWELIETPFIHGGTSGIFSIAFYDDLNGFAVGGDFANPEGDVYNKAITNDGGKTWKIVADNEGVYYKSCVQYVPNGNANELVAVGKNGIVYSNNAGKKWKQLSDEGFYTIRFVNDSIAFAAGHMKIAKLHFK